MNGVFKFQVKRFTSTKPRHPGEESYRYETWSTVFAMEGSLADPDLCKALQVIKDRIAGDHVKIVFESKVEF